MNKKLKIEIKTLFGVLLFEHEAVNNTVKETLQVAVSQKKALSGADLRGAYLEGADLEGADLRGADLRGADLRGSPLAKLPQGFINLASRDMLFIFRALKHELPFLRDKLIKGEVEGTQYEGDCACLIGTFANSNGGVEQVCGAIPFYDKGLHNPAENWFYNIQKGDTPENSDFAKHALFLIDQVLGEQP